MDYNTALKMFGLEWRVSHQFNLSHLLFQEKKGQTGSYLQNSDAKFKDTQAKIGQLTMLSKWTVCSDSFLLLRENSLGFLVQYLKKYKIYDG